METVNNMAAAAAKAVWGENTTTANNETHGQEPISGAQGNVSKGEPFDKGNLDPQPDSTTANNETHGKEPISGAQGDVSKGEPFDKGNLDPQPNVASVSSSSNNNNNEPNAASLNKNSNNSHNNEPSSTKTNTTTESQQDSAQFAKTTGTAAESDKTPDNKQTELKAKDTPADTTKSQNDTRDPENPSTNPKNAPTDVDNTGEGINEGQNLDAPGPKPLNEVARDHGGDAGKINETSSNKEDGGIVGDKQKNEGGESQEDPNDPHAKSSGEGTGEKWVKTSGLQADGGDFDATKPGAGREADRLLEEKGIHTTKGVPGKPEDEGAADKDSGSGEKKGTFSKLKEKLHRH